MEKKKKKKRIKLIPSRLMYTLARIGSGAVARFLYKRKFMRNEIKNIKGPAVILANHESALDFVNLINASKAKMNFVVSSSFYNTLPVRGAMRGAGVIPKNQFQTNLHDIGRMREVIHNNGILVMYPAGLMCEDGISTPIPEPTYRFVQWLATDVYIARSYGTYFCKPKWARRTRPGRTYIDIYKLCSKEELASMSVEEFRKMCEEALLFDAYREQEELLVKYKGGDNLEGLENILYVCPHCRSEHKIVTHGNTIRCTECGYEEYSDEYGFLHKRSECGAEMRYVSDWNGFAVTVMSEKINTGAFAGLYSKAKIYTIDYKKKKYTESGEGELELKDGMLHLRGVVKGEEVDISTPASRFPSLPFKPGVNIDFQHGDEIYRLELEDGRLCMEFVNAVKYYYQASIPEEQLRERERHDENTVAPTR